MDASYAVHPNMRSHTGSILTLAKGTIQAKSTKQKINTKSSTEAELIASDDVLPDFLWVNYFLEEQGYISYKIVMLRDNKSWKRMGSCPVLGRQNKSMLDIF